MKFIPINSYVQVEKIPEVKKESMVMLPVDYTEGKFATPYMIVNFVQALDNCCLWDFDLYSDSKLIIDRSMLEEIDYNNEKIFIIKECFIKGIINA